MSKSLILRIIVAIAIIGGGIFVIIKDEPQPPTGDINNVVPFPKQDNQ